MEKEKKALQGNLLTNTLLYTVLSIGALIGLSYLLTWGLIYAGIFLGYYITTGFTVFQSFPFVIAVVLLGISALTIYIGAKNGRQLWAQWQRKRALADEEKRILRLLDEEESLDDFADSAENNRANLKNKP